MVDARNAQLAADTMRFGGANQAELWLAYARRGFGRAAASTNGLGRTAGVESDTDPLPDFEAPGQGNATLTLRCDDASTRRRRRVERARLRRPPRGARVADRRHRPGDERAGHGARRTTSTERRRSRPGTYEFVATAPGYGAVRFRAHVPGRPGADDPARMAPNVASKSQGATASGDAAPVMSGTTTVLSAAQVRDRLIDDTEATHWQAAAVESRRRAGASTTAG